MRRVEDDEERKIEPNEPEEGEYVNPATTAMNDMNMWVHANTSILDNCRTTHLIPDDIPEEKDPEEFKAEIEKADPFEPLLKPITDDD